MFIVFHLRTYLERARERERQRLAQGEDWIIERDVQERERESKGERAIEGEKMKRERERERGREWANERDGGRAGKGNDIDNGINDDIDGFWS